MLMLEKRENAEEEEAVEASEVDTEDHEDAHEARDDADQGRNRDESLQHLQNETQHIILTYVMVILTSGFLQQILQNSFSW